MISKYHLSFKHFWIMWNIECFQKHDVVFRFYIIFCNQVTSDTEQIIRSKIKWIGYSFCQYNRRCGFESQSGQTKNCKKSYLQLLSLTFSNQKKGECKASTVFGRKSGRWQLDLKFKRYLSCLLVKATW